ncbi:MULTISPECIES: Dyp-type peroxidase [Micromonospora]|uniref:Dye decolorizing peroxidase n=1 Tax=Micromonospora yangpuensis TaxID=683228 RepID=A0A1C6UWX5_9ACTN|nr:Dyp-type peroxidase [Micromonospora yangpuensis]GGM25080.1 peroxidase [Micromonospora yangpuensis]SCL58488.1 dye decolorizing peroxidase [Micromonospora yangpuensis]
MSETPAADPTPESPPQKVEERSRRAVLLGGVAAAGIGAASAVGLESFVSGREAQARDAARGEADTANGLRKVPFHGEHQAGVEMLPQAHQSLVSLALRPEADRDTIRRLLVTLTDDAARLTAGNYALADSEPELALVPARLTITFGFGRGLVDRVAPGAAPTWLTDLPPFGVDRLQDRWNGGDLVLQIAADDPLTVAHAQRMLLKDSRTATTVKWIQTGFLRAYGSERAGRTPRNLLGQVDGTKNVTPGTPDYTNVVWQGSTTNPDWLAGGTGFVVRRIEMLLDKWDRLDRSGRELSVGRRMDSGAPLTGKREDDEPDFSATTPLGFPVIAEFAHIRRARTDDPRQRIFRRAYNYDLTPEGDQVSNSGMIFTSFQHDVTAQFLPIQRRIDEVDLLNEWVVPIGSAVFAIPPGCAEGGFIGETLFAG